MEKNRKFAAAIIAILLISVLGLGIAFAVFSQTLTIGGSGTVESSNWEVVFEGTDGTSTLGSGVTTGSAEIVTAPTIKNEQTEISNYSVTLKAPGDSVTYNFRIHNKGDFAASVSSVDIKSKLELTTNTSKRTSEANTLNAVEYKLYYTDNNLPVGQDAGKDCLEPGEYEYENVTLRIVFSSTNETDASVLPSEDLELDNLGVEVIYNQANNNSCTPEVGETVTNKTFTNIDGAYYTYEGKSFIGTGVDNLIISENLPSLAKWSSAAATECSDGSTPTNNKCPAGTTPVFNDHPAADVANAYCTGCRLMTHSEANSWCGPDFTANSKCVAKYGGSANSWWLADANNTNLAWTVDNNGFISHYNVTYRFSVRPVVSISSTATMAGSGTSDSPYVISE